MRKLTVEKTASRGIAIAPAYVYSEVDLSPDNYTISEQQDYKIFLLFRSLSL